ncbi:MAG TPA: hypothetical protein VFV33_22215, partial [Gemmatimonadaceae bacterium]|nr:hypothetical protein [Gemmatimonadaceae bacterium]
LQGKVTDVKFATGPVALPGVNGDKVPGPTELGPNRWVQHVQPALYGTPGVTARPAEAKPAESTTTEGAAQPAKTGEHE